MFKRDDVVFPKWQGFAGSMLLRKPFSETADLRSTLADYNSISRDLGPKILVGAKERQNFRKEKDCVGRYRVQGSFPGLYELGVAVLGHDQGRKVNQDDVLGQTQGIRSRIQPYGTHHDLLKKLENSQRKMGLSQTILPLTQKKIGNRNEDEKKLTSEEEREISRDAADEKRRNVLASILRPRPQPVSDRHDGIVDGSSVCGFLLEDGTTTCTTTPVEGRKICRELKGQRISPCSGKECEETENICGVILPDMELCRRKPVSRRKRCEDHKGMRVNAFFFLLNPTEREKLGKEDNKSKPESKNQEDSDSGPGLSCEATTKNGSRCTRSVPAGSRRCWQHKDKTLDSENVQPKDVNQVICGVKLCDGSVCEKTPVKGRKRCEEHKGMRITS